MIQAYHATGLPPGALLFIDSRTMGADCVKKINQMRKYRDAGSVLVLQLFAAFMPRITFKSNNLC